MASFTSTCAAVLKAAAQKGQAQQGPLKLDEASKKKILAEVAKLMGLLEGDSVSIADCDAIEGVISGIFESNEFVGGKVHSNIHKPKPKWSLHARASLISPVTQQTERNSSTPPFNNSGK